MPTNYYLSQDQITTINDIFQNPPTGNPMNLARRSVENAFLCARFLSPNVA